MILDENRLWRTIQLDELRLALELANEEELQHITDLLFSRKFNPLDYFNNPQPIDIKNRDRQSWLDAIDHRFRYLAADGMTVLKGKASQFTYRQALIQVSRFLKIKHTPDITTTELEAEIFLYLIGKTWNKLPSREQKIITNKIQKSLNQGSLPSSLPTHLEHPPLPTILKGGSAIAINNILRPLILKQIARQFALHFATYQVAQDIIIKGGITAAAHLQNQIAISSAQRGMAISAARYATVKSIFAIVGPIMWTWLIADLGWKAISTNYSRIIPTIFTLAQIRLTRMDLELWEIA